MEMKVRRWILLFCSLMLIGAITFVYIYDEGDQTGRILPARMVINAAKSCGVWYENHLSNDQRNITVEAKGKANI
jgi:hypothetical protein